MGDTLTQERGSLGSVAARDAEDEGLEGVEGGDDAESKGRPVDDIVLLLGKDTEQVPGQDQGTSYCSQCG